MPPSSDQVIYRNNPAKAFAFTILGGLMTFGFFLPISIGRVFFLFIGLTVFFTSLVALLNRKKQIVIDHDGIYLGFKIKDRVAWKNIVGINVKQENVDGRQVWLLKLKAKMTRQGKAFYKSHTANLDYLKIDRLVIMDQIEHYRGTKGTTALPTDELI